MNKPHPYEICMKPIDLNFGDAEDGTSKVNMRIQRIFSYILVLYLETFMLDLLEV